jgi:FAD/FMN-containing dehydrogenase
MINEQIIGQLKHSFHGELFQDEQNIQKYSRDASIFQVRPALVAVPRDIHDLKTLIKFVATKKQEGVDIAIAPRGGGTCMSGGSLTQYIVVDMTQGFNWVGEFDVRARRVWAGLGTYYRDLESAASTEGLLFAPYTSSKHICTVGGMLGNNASGEKSIRYGATVDNVSAVNMVCSDGNEYEFKSLTIDEVEAKKSQDNFEGHIYREITKLTDKHWAMIQTARPKVKKNAAGYAIWKVWNRDRTELNLSKMLVGSQGTLGCMTSARLRLIDDYKYAKMLLLPIDNLSELASAVKIILQHSPEGLETYDHHTFKLAKIHMADDANLVSKYVDGQHMVLFAQFVEASKDQTDNYAEICYEALRRAKFNVSYVDSPAERDAHWRIRRASFGLLKDHSVGARAVPFIEDTIVSIDHYGEYLSALEAILSDYDMDYTYAGHIGDGSIRLIPLVDMEAEGAADRVFECARRVYDLVFAFGGSMSVDHNDGLIRTPYLERMYGHEVNMLFKKIKMIFDPLAIYNPGKKVYGDIAYSKDHMLKTNS